jgi:diacylglycerol kinase family enzyme
VAAYFSYRPQPCTIRNGDQTLTTPAFIVSIANSDQYGNDCFIAPGAQVDDGRLDMTIVKQVGLVGILPLAVRLFTRSIGGSRSVQRLSGSHFVIERQAPGLIHTDGETHQTGAIVEVSVQPHSLRVLVPVKTS